MEAEAHQLDLSLHPKQALALETTATEVLYGGAAGGGKSHLMRVAAIIWCTAIPGLQVYLFRRIRNDLIKSHMDGPKGFRAMLAGWERLGFCKIVGDEIRFWNGSKIHLCHCKDAKDVYKYQGAEIHVLMIDELTHFLEPMYRFLRGRVRAVGLNLPDWAKGAFPRILCGANPGNVGHLFVKRMWVDGAEPLAVRQMEPEEGGKRRQYIPALLEDNPSMTEDDPTYEHTLAGLGSPDLVKAMRWGDWNVALGAFFANFDVKRHVVQPFTVPEHWTRFMSKDWGSATPGSVGWWTIATDTITVDGYVPRQRTVIPRGAIVRYREWYVAKPDGTGLMLSNAQLAQGIKDREGKDRITYRVADPSMWQVKGGPSIAHELASHGLHFTEADNKRTSHGGKAGTAPLSGWAQMNSRLIGNADGDPMIFCFTTCRESIRTIPVLMHDKSNPEDVDTDMEDHCFAAGTMVETVSGPVAIEQLPREGSVLSIGGRYERYRSARMTRRNANVVRVTFANGRQVVCTPDHRFLVGIDEWRYAADLKGERVLCSQLPSATRSRSSTAFGSIGAACTISDAAFGFIASFGKRCAALFRAAIMCTTSTVTERTTPSTILSAFQSSTISVGDTETIAAPAVVKPSKWLDPALLNGTVRKKARNGIVSSIGRTALRLWSAVSRGHASSAASSLLDQCSPIGSAATPVRALGAVPVARTTKAGRVSSAAVSSRSISTGQAGPARPFVVRAVECINVEPAGRADVYCITVPATGCFAIEGGLLVSNCADEWRYACMSRPWVPAPQKKPSLLDAYKIPQGGRTGGTNWKTV